MDYEKEYKRKALGPIVNYIESVMASYSKEELEARIKEALPKKESEDERIRKEIIRYLKSKVATAEETELLYFKRWIAHLEKQKEQPISAEEVLARAGLKPYKDGNQWCILAGDNIQEGVCGFGDTIEDALYEFLKEVLDFQKKQKPALTPERIHPKFAVGDTVCRPMWSDHTIREIYVRCNDPVYVCVNEEGTESHISFSEQDEWERKEQKPAEWSEEDEEMLVGIIERGSAQIPPHEPALREEQMEWLMNRLKSLRPQPKEDLNAIAQREYARGKQDGYWEGVKAERESCKTFHYESPNWPPKMPDLPTETTTNEGVSSIQPHWKPSDVQMEALAWYSGNSGVPPTGDKAIKSLYIDLQKLL